MKWNLIFDVDKCTGCQNCTLAVQDEYVGNTFPGYAAEMPRRGHRWVEIRRRDRGSHPIVDAAYAFHACQHCDDAPCIAAAKDGAVTKRADGIVLIDPVKSKGQKAIAEACPYGAVSWNEERQIPQHWNFDAHLLDAGWSVPRPVQACPTGALRAVKVSDAEMRRVAKAEGLEPLRPDLNHKPRIHYRNLKRVNREMLGGALLTSVDGRDECVAGAVVSLFSSKELLQKTQSDAFGEFRFDGLAAGNFRLEVAGKSFELRLETSTNLGDIRV